MKFILFLTIICLSGFVLFIVSNNMRYSEVSASAKTYFPAFTDNLSSPENTVSNYCSLSKKSKSSDIKELVTALPDTYLRYLFVSKQDGKNKYDNSETSVTENGKKTILTADDEIKGLRNSTGDLNYRMVTANYTETIRTMNLEFREVTDKKIKGDDARLRVRLHSTKKQFRDVKLVFYLHKEYEKWRIFKITEDFLIEDFPN